MAGSKVLTGGFRLSLFVSKCTRPVISRVIQNNGTSSEIINPFISGLQVRYRRKFERYRNRIDSPIAYEDPDEKRTRPNPKKTPFVELTPNVNLEQDIFDPHKIEALLREKEWDKLKEESKTDQPLSSLPNPYAEAPRKCILCEQEVQLDYKNVRLLSQFVSSHTGQIYGRHITGLCVYMQKRVTQLIQRSRTFGYMPYVMKDPQYLRDPKLFDPFRRK